MTKDLKPGQFWRSNETGVEYVVTRTYGEFLEFYAVLRWSDGSGEDFRRVKVQRDSQGDTLPGFTLVEG